MQTMKLFLPAIVTLLSLWAISKSSAADESQLVTNLPGQPTVSFKQYAGYVTVNESHGRALFYWFYESESPNAANRPLVLWLNGGPGCSSIGTGALYELGPFFPSDNTALHGLITLNKHSWTKAANIIFLESPFGVGFSYSNTSSDYNQYTDEAVANDAHAFLVGWLKKFPEYRHNEFYITGESYAGHYIPTLARVIVEQNKLSEGFHINFQGFAIGNPWTDAYSDNSGAAQFYFSHSLISDQTYTQIKANCDFASYVPLVSAGASNATGCDQAVRQADDEMTYIDTYDIYGFSCNTNSSSRSSSRAQVKAFFSTAAYTDPCLDSVTPFLNIPEVQAALHVTSPVVWHVCSGVVLKNYSRVDKLQSMIPLYRELLKEGLRIWIYSGDTDGIVPTLGTRKWIAKLKLPVEVPWYAWNYNNQVGGWTQQYKGLTFASVRGAGHLVPATQPGRALAMFRSFLSGKPLPTF